MATLKVPVTESDHVQGSADALVTLVEYGDYECPHCGHAHPVVKLLQEQFGEQLRFVFRNFPLKEVHPNAESAAESAEFAGVNGQFWEMHDGIFENQDAIGLPLMFELAEGLELSVPEHCREPEAPFPAPIRIGPGNGGERRISGPANHRTSSSPYAQRA